MVRSYNKATPKQIYHHPMNEYVAGLFGSYNLIDIELLKSFSNIKFKNNWSKLLLRPEQLSIVDEGQSIVNRNCCSELIIMVAMFNWKFKLPLTYLK